MLHTRPDYRSIQDPTGHIPADEPVFLLRAQDQHAAETIRYYAAIVELVGGDKTIVEHARQLAVAMDAWPHKKAPDCSPLSIPRGGLTFPERSFGERLLSAPAATSDPIVANVLTNSGIAERLPDDPDWLRLTDAGRQYITELVALRDGAPSGEPV